MGGWGGCVGRGGVAGEGTHLYKNFSIFLWFTMCLYSVATLRQKQNSLTFHRLFPDQIQFFTNQKTAVLRPICQLAADKWRIPVTSSFKCTCLILQMKQIKSLNSFLAQNVLKLPSFHSFKWAKWAREKTTLLKNQHFFSISSSQNTCYNTYFGPKLWNSLTFLVFKISLTNLQNSLTFPWPVAILKVHV